MSVKKIIELMTKIHPLDRVPRAGYLLRGVTEPESVAAHSHGLALLTLLVCEEHPDEFDSAKAVRIAIVHDLQESFTMDIPMPAGNANFKAAKSETENEIYTSLFADQAESLKGLHREFEEAATQEGRLVRGLDKVQMMIKILNYEREGRGDLREFWEHKANFKDYGLPVITDLFAEIAGLKASSNKD
ncbi:MAG: HD family hydrolase [Spirochaetales bacterium]|jgi:putative hydrolases of HD superfamily|nr:HD family hydrolase [Spirochaetales bacterium]